MKHVNRLIFMIGLTALFYCGLSPFGGVVFAAASIPVITPLPVIKEGAVTPTRLVQDNLGYIYVTDPHAEGILKYDSLGNLLQKIITAKEPGGIAVAKNGDLLVTQGTYVAALDPVSGTVRTFGTFLYAFSIAVDNRPAGTGYIYVSDIKGSIIQVFNDTYGLVDMSAGTGHNPGPNYGYGGGSAYAQQINTIGDSITNGVGNAFFSRPAGVAIEKSSGSLAVVDSLIGSVKFFDQNGNTAGTFGAFGYDPTHAGAKFVYPQSIAFEYTAGGALYRAYILDTFQSYVMAVDASVAAITPDDIYGNSTISWPWLADIGSYGHANGNLIAPSDILVDRKDPDNNRLVVTNGFGSLSVFGIGSLQPYNVAIDSITNNSMRVTWANSTIPFQAIHVYRSTVAGQLGTQVGGNLPSSTTSFTNNTVSDPLAPYTTYYYTVRAVDNASVETTNISQVSAKTTGLFNLSININGNGQVNGTAACTTGTCTSSQNSDALITLTATATGQSVFDGWTGDCFTTADTCLISMDAAKSVTAFFSAKLAFRVGGAYFDNLNDAYREAKDGSVIQVLAGTWPSTTHPTEYMTAWQAKTVTIQGGYDPTFTTISGSSTVTGRTNLSAGKVIMKKFKVKQ
jgi:Divergent InlB B-repeat domain